MADKEVLDYGRSFVTFTTPGRGNNARLQVESVGSLIDRDAGTTVDYLFFASCKSENTYAERDLFHAENYDFCGIFGGEEFVIFRTRATHHEGFRDQGRWPGRFEDLSVRTVHRPARELVTGEEIVRATLDGFPLVGVVEMGGADASLRARLEFPIKTMNVNDQQMIWQVDTGPVPFPDLDPASPGGVARLRPA
ncbi:MAG: hypothetical protein ABIL09_06380, partial [Gemmatimonadota bacterium]